MSGGVSTVDDNVGSLVGQKRCGQLFDSVRGEVNRTGQVHVIIGRLRQCFDKPKLVAALDLVKQIVSRNCLDHNFQFPSLGYRELWHRYKRIDYGSGFQSVIKSVLIRGLLFRIRIGLRPE